jgi:hypothetical protein
VEEAPTAFWRNKIRRLHRAAGSLPRCDGPIIMPENGRENKAGCFVTVTFGLIFGLKS